MRSLLTLLCSPLVIAALAWAVFAACLDEPVASEPAFARLVTTWDPLACDAPHRVVIELTDDDAAQVSASVPCNLGGVTLELAQFGAYRGRIYAWAFGAAIRSVTALEVRVDEPIVRQFVVTPR